MTRRTLSALMLAACCAMSANADVTVEQCVEAARENYPIIRKYDILNQSVRIDLSDINRSCLPQIGVYAQGTVQNVVPSFPDALSRILEQIGQEMSGLGVTIANKSATILQSIFIMFAFIMIFQLMGGLLTPISSMPQWAQYITYAVPPRYFIEIMRALYLKGAGIADLSAQYAALAGYAIFFCSLAALTYKKRA